MNNSTISNLKFGAKSSHSCIVLDLDGTLVFSSKKKQGIADNVTFNSSSGESKQIWVHKRPGFDAFLQACFEHSEVGVWSMGQPGYVEAVVSLFPRRPSFVYNWCDCDRNGGRVFKRLSNIPHAGNILMVDDKSDTLEICDGVQTIIVPEWTPKSKGDTVLPDLAFQLYH